MDKKKTILVIDDMNQIRTILRFSLEKRGYNVLVANSGQRGLDIASGKTPPDLIILDVMMPKMDGYEVIRRLRESDSTRSIPIIFLTAKAQKKDVLKGMESGADDYAVKPFNFEDINNKVEKLLGSDIEHPGVEKSNRKNNQLVSDKPATIPVKDTQKAIDDTKEQTPGRMLAAILITDIVGFSKEMENDEERTYSKLLITNDIIREITLQNRGEEIKTIGDSFLIKFNSVVDAVKTGIDIQNEFGEYNKDKNNADQISIRIGIHIGDILLRDDDVFGDGINVASRIVTIADPGGICISADVYNLVKKIVHIEVMSLGIKELKNIKDPPEIFKIIVESKT
jgi:DNA-binding response OmpR family regulator